MAEDYGTGLVYGPLVLSGHVLTGPTGWISVSPSEQALLHRFMQGGVVGLAELAAIAFPSSQPQPRRPGHAVAMRVSRVRKLLNWVGVFGDALRSFPRVGYGLGIGGAVSRTFVGPKVALLDRLLATHPDRSAVTRLAA